MYNYFFTVISNPDKVRESIQEYQDKLKEKEMLESSLPKLRQEYFEQKAKLTPTTIATTPRKKTKQEQLDDLFDVVSNYF